VPQIAEADNKDLNLRILLNIIPILQILGLLLMPIDPSYAQGIRKIVDANGVTYFTNEPPEKDSPVKPSPTTSVAVPETFVAPVTTQVQAIKPVDNPKPPQSATSQSANQPINPAQALGDWPPKSLKLTPAAVP
jgi:hypothetical protein